jgi:4-carboxymuconolactone decarboxylase
MRRSLPPDVVIAAFVAVPLTIALVLPVQVDSTTQQNSHPKRGTQVTTADKRSRPQQPRIDTVKKESWTPAQRELLEPLEKTGRLYNIFQTLANHPTLQKEWMTFATYILRNNTLPPRDREILILRIGWLCKAEYEWAQHVRIGKRAGLTDDEIRGIQEGPAAALWNDHDRLLLKATDELHADACVSDATWQALSKNYDTRQMMDVVFTVGQYNLVSMALNSFGVQLDEGLEGFEK